MLRSIGAETFSHQMEHRNPKRRRYKNIRKSNMMKLCVLGSQIDPKVANTEALLSLLREDSQRYGSFLVYAGNLMETSFAEERYWSGSGKEGSVLSCCESCTKFNTNLSYLQGEHKLGHNIVVTV